MIEYSKPRFMSFDEMNNIDKSKTTAICQCPVPLMVVIDGVEGGYCHVVEYEKKYVCKQCGTEFSVGKYFTA